VFVAGKKLSDVTSLCASSVRSHTGSRLTGLVCVQCQQQQQQQQQLQQTASSSYATSTAGAPAGEEAESAQTATEWQDMADCAQWLLATILRMTAIHALAAPEGNPEMSHLRDWAVRALSQVDHGWKPC